MRHRQLSYFALSVKITLYSQKEGPLRQYTGPQFVLLHVEYGILRAYSDNSFWTSVPLFSMVISLFFPSMWKCYAFCHISSCMYSWATIEHGAGDPPSLTLVCTVVGLTQMNLNGESWSVACLLFPYHSSVMMMPMMITVVFILLQFS